MSKISELGPITGANTRSEDLFVIVNLIQGDDGTKNITRYELVEAIQYEVFTRITITGGSISGTNMFSNFMDNNEFVNGTIDDSVLTNVEINTFTADDGTITNSKFNDGTANNVVITQSQFNNSTGNNDIFTNSVIDNSQFNNGTGNNNIFTNSQIDDSLFNNVTIEGGTANNLTITNIILDNVVMTDALISNSDIRDTDLDNVFISNSVFTTGEITDSAITDGTMTGTVLTTVEITDSDITLSDFSDGTGSNNVFTDSVIDNSLFENGVIANTVFQGGLDDVVITNATISSSSSDGLEQNRSKIYDSDLSNTNIEDSNLIDFDMELHKVWQPEMDEDSWFAIKNAKTGETEKITYRQYFDEISKSTESSLKVYVSNSGDDKNPGTILQPVRNLKRAAELALEKAGGSYDRNDINSAVHISVGPGVYWVDDPIWLPDDCSMTSTAGQYATIIRKKPGYERTNGILVGSGNYVQGFAYMNFEVDNFDYPEGGFAIAYRPGALLRRSPYIRDSSQLSNFNRLDIEPPLQPFNTKGTIADLGLQLILAPGHGTNDADWAEGDTIEFSNGAKGYVSWSNNVTSDSELYVRNIAPWGSVEDGMTIISSQGKTATIQTVGIDDFPNRLVGRGGGCLLADRRVVDPDSLYIYVLCFGFTPRTQNGMGYVARDGAGVNGIGSLSIFVRTAFYALNGGQMTLNNSGTQFGDISMRSKGSTRVIQPATTSATLLANTAFADVIDNNRDAIIEDMISYLNANTANGGLEYQGYDSVKCKRDTGIIVDNVGYDVALDTNYWGRLNGITYRSPISYVVVNEQLTETVGAIEHLKDEMNYVFANADASVNSRIDRSVDETLNILNNGEPYASDIIFADTGVEARTNARQLLQDNRDLIIEGMVDWIDNNDEFFAYDSATCRRDIQEYILPATKWDMVLDTNYNSVTAGNAYYFKQAKTVAENQREETVGSFKYLRDQTDTLIDANSSIGSTRIYEKFNNVINILENTGTKYTPTNVTYNPATGEAVFTIGLHNLTVGRYITLMTESIEMSCDTDGNVLKYSHPRVTDPAYKAALPILEVTSTTFTINVGATGYNGVHTFISAATNAVSVVGDAITFSDNASIAADKRNARKQLQANKEYIQDAMMNWADNEWFFYDSKKCQRDTNEYILPAVKRDMITGTNFNAIQNGIAYRQAITSAVPGTQLSETVGAFSHLRDEVIADITDPIAISKVTDSFNEIINIMQNGGRKYTPTDATYDPVTGIFTATIGEHDFEVNDYFLMEKESITFSCANTATGEITEISHPRTTDATYKTPVQITGVTDTTITANVGNAGGYAGVHTFARAKLNAIQKDEPLNGAWTPTNATYDPTTGVTVLTIGSHDLQVGDTVILSEESISFSCVNTATSATVEISHPRATDPAFNTPLTITAISGTTITINSGDANGYTGAHTFVGAKPNAVKKSGIYTGKFTPTNADYNPISGDITLTIGQHSLYPGKWITLAPEGITLSCVNTATSATVEISHPRRTDAAFKEPVRITGVTSDTITVNVGNAGGYTGAHTFVSAVPGAVDTNAIYWTDSAKITDFITPSDVTYDPVTGDFVISTAENHGLTTDDHIELKPHGITMSCVNTATSAVETISHPRIGDHAYGRTLAITAVTANTMTVNVGSANGYTGAHTFVSADEGAVMQVSSSEEGQYAAEQLQANKLFIQEEVDAWLRANYFVYKGDKCMRDTGLILDAVRRDLLTDSNVNAVFAGLAYRSGNAATDSVIANELTETVGAINWLKSEIAGLISSDATGVARANAAFDEIIDIMNNGTAAANVRVFGTDSVDDDTLQAQTALQANKQFIIDETTAWITTNYPSLSYDSAKCERDVGYFTDSVIWDVTHGSNAATVNNSRLYFDNAVGILEWDERAPTAAAFEFVADLAGRIVRNEAVANTQPTTQTLQLGDAYTPTDASYDPVTGITVLTIGAHTYSEGDYIIIEDNSLEFRCGFPGTNILHPRPTDPASNRPLEILAADSTTITVNVGDANGYTGVHTFLSSQTDAVRRSTAPSVSKKTQDLYKIVADMVRGNDFAELPAITEPTGYAATQQASAGLIAGNTAKYQTEIIDFIRETYNGLAYDTDLCYRDVGYIVDAVSEDIEYGGNAATVNAAKYYFAKDVNAITQSEPNSETYPYTAKTDPLRAQVNILPLYQREATRLAFEHLADVVEEIVQETAVANTAGNVTRQDTTGDPGDASIALAAKNLVNIISGIADDNTWINIPDVSGAPAMEPSRTFTRKSLQKNKEFIQDEIINYIDQEFFIFEEGKCQRDTAYILNGVKRDVLTGATYNSKYVGKCYRAGTVGTDVVLEDQLAETVQAVKWMQSDIESRLKGTALSRATAAFENVIDAMVNDYDSDASPYNFGDSYYTLGAQPVASAMQLNRTFLQEEAIAWVNQEYPSLSYDSAKCRRDVGYMVDAITWDLLNNTNVATSDVARMYFENGLSHLPANQKAETAALYVHLADRTQKILSQTTFTPTPGNGETVNTGFGTITAPVYNKSLVLWAIVSDVITEDSLINLPTAVEPSSTGLGAGAAGYSEQDAYDIIEGRIAPLAAQVTQYLKDTFDYLEYDQAKCRRDIGYMVDAISHDIQYGGNAAMWNAAQIYFVNAVNLLPRDQREATRKAFTHLADVVYHVARNEQVPIKLGRTFTPTTATYDPITGESVITLGSGHNLKVGDYITLAAGSLTFSCNSTEISHPRVTDPAFNTPLVIIAKTATTITVNVGHANGYTGTHTFVSAAPNAVGKVIGNTQKQYTDFLAARREIAQEAKDLAMIVANVSGDNNPTNVPIRIEPKTDWVPQVLIDERNIIDANSNALTTDMINFITSEYKGISYPKQTCRRDVGIIVDALSHDINYTTNYATRLATNMYFSYGSSVLPFDQRTQTADFYVEMSKLVNSVVQGTAAGQDLTNTVATSVEGEYVEDLVNMIEDAIRRDSLDALPAIVEPDTSWVDNSLLWAAEEIDTNLDQLADATTRWINENFNVLDYNKAKCYRDGGYLVDAFSWDLNYGGNLASRWNADFYFWNSVFRIPEDQRVPTGQAYRRLGEICRDVVLGVYPGQVTNGNVSTQAEADHAYELGDIFYKVFTAGTPKALPATIEPDFTYGDTSTVSYSFARRILNNRKKVLQSSVMRFIGQTYKFYDINLARRDANNLLTSIKQDFEYVNYLDQANSGSYQGVRTFVAALFDGNAKHVFPVFNPSSSMTRGMKFIDTLQFTGDLPTSGNKVNDAYIVSTDYTTNRYAGNIYRWNGNNWINEGANNVELLESFYLAWRRINTYIKTNLSPDAAHSAMLDGLFEDILEASTLRPSTLTFGSLVESIAHQFNGASAGVNRTALPLNFRNLGAAISASASVISEDGGRVRWSGADELNNQYFARGLRINGRTGRIEGRPFTSSVRKLARRASNSRANI